jgi:hypothetical protein
MARHQFIVKRDLAPEIAFDVADQLFHCALFFLGFRIAIGVDRELVAVDVPFAFLERLPEVGVNGEPADERIPAFDIDVDVWQRLKFGRVPVIRIFQKFDPQPKPAYFD